MEHDAWIILAVGLGGFCAGVMNAWAILWPLSSEDRDAFLAGVMRAFAPWKQ